MKSRFKTFVYALCISFVSILTVSTFMSPATALARKNADDASFTFTAAATVNYTVNYYLPNAAGTSFVLNSSETVAQGSTLSSVPTPATITDFTFEKWSTSSSFSDSFNTSSAINSNLNLYAGYCGYYVKGSSDSSYTLINKTSGSVNKYKFNGTNNYDTFSYTYGLIGSAAGSQNIDIATQRIQGSTIKAYKRYRGTNTYSEIESKTSKASDGLYKVYFNPNNSSGNKLYFVRTFIIELQEYEADVYMHLWDTSNSSVSTQWKGIQASYMGRVYEDGKNKKYWAFDVDLNKVNKFKANDGDYGGIELQFGNNTNDTYWTYQYGTGGWYQYSINKVLN